MAERLKECHFINRDSEELLTLSQKYRIYDYIDDVCIDYYFEKTQFPPLVLKDGLLKEIITPDGYKSVQEPIIINLNDLYGRANFLRWFVLICQKKMYGNRIPFFDKLALDRRSFCGGCSAQSTICTTYGYKNPYTIEWFDHKYNYYELYRSEQLTMCFEFIDSYRERYGFPLDENDVIIMRYYELCCVFFNHYSDLIVVDGYTWQDLFSIYALLVEKLKIRNYSITGILCATLFFDGVCQSRILKQFFDFEKVLDRIIDREKQFNEDDLFLRFIKINSSNSYKMIHNHGVSFIQRFEEPPIKILDEYDPLCLPFKNSQNNQKTFVL